MLRLDLVIITLLSNHHSLGKGQKKKKKRQPEKENRKINLKIIKKNGIQRWRTHRASEVPLFVRERRSSSITPHFLLLPLVDSPDLSVSLPLSLDRSPWYRSPWAMLLTPAWTPSRGASCSTTSTYPPSAPSISYIVLLVAFFFFVFGFFPVAIINLLRRIFG